MANLYHQDIYNFNEPIKSYWETTTNAKNKYEELKKKYTSQYSCHRWWVYRSFMRAIISKKLQ